MKKWLIRLKGHEFDLQDLVVLFNQPDLNIIEKQGNYYLKSSELNSILDANDVYKRAVGFLKIMNGIAIINNLKYRMVEVDAISEISKNGSYKNYIYPHEEINMRSKVSATATVIKSDGSIDSTQSQRDYKPWITLAMNNRDVLRAFEFLIDETWYSLYKALEVIGDDLGKMDKIIKRGWATKKMLKRFTQTAQSEQVLGDEARHASKKFKPPNDPMSKLEAQSFINNVMNKWISSKI